MEGHHSVFSAPGTPAVFSPTVPFQHDDLRRDDLSSSSSDDSEKEDEFERGGRAPSYRRPFQASHRKSSGFSAVSQLFGERWPNTPVNRFNGPTTERNIDFELDIRVEIDSGKCVLHPTTQQPEHEDVSLRRSCERSLRSLDQESPPKKKKLQTNYTSSSHLLAGKKCPSTLQTKSNDMETTVFYIPGVDVKLHYNSKTLKTESPNTSRGSSLPRTLSKESKLFAKGKSPGGVKTAKLYAWVALQTLPEEMVISPCLLDFLEKALETIPITPVERSYTAVASQEEDMAHFETVEPLEESTTSLVSSSTSAYSSFPVDVVVYVRVQPSQIRFSCLPVSRVECMLKLPSLDLVFSSNRGELEPTPGPHSTEGSHPPSSTPPGMKSGEKRLKVTIMASPLLGSPLGRSRHSSSQSDLSGPPTTSSGLSFTACMSDFSLYVFHPYGAGKQKSAVTGLPPGPGPLDEEPSSVTGRKDSLSINLEFVKVSLSRMRRTGGPTFIESFIPAKGGKMDTTLINISAVCDIGSASFKYDMRRLSEILAFPRAWYRRSIARRLFLGDQTINLPELNLLRNVEANNQESGVAAKSSSLLSSFRSSSSYNHETETIFALPRMQLDFKSIHNQEPNEPSLSDADSKPKVECSVVTEFTDHICVTMDAELIMFLHDLVAAYLKEKEKALFAPRMFAARPGQKSPPSLHDHAHTDKDDNINYTTVDWREFMCNTWHLEPTLRLISWTGRKIDPVGVDYILQKLGFHHARTTIPKWLQRGVMDPLDKVLSVLIKKLGTALQDEKEKKGRDKDEH
uniref:Bridge-like lipid transfer protein family member 1 C-terminal domain-containing protein n=1 Tax=Gouania willdenowi TaxID=441366 RepID=A0A8C5G2G3_GOUWI